MYHHCLLQWRVRYIHRALPWTCTCLWSASRRREWSAQLENSKSGKISVETFWRAFLVAKRYLDQPQRAKTHACVYKYKLSNHVVLNWAPIERKIFFTQASWTIRIIIRSMFEMPTIMYNQLLIGCTVKQDRTVTEYRDRVRLSPVVDDRV